MLARMRHSSLAAPFARWRQVTDDARKHRATSARLQRLMLRMLHRTASVALATWADNAADQKRLATPSRS
jgi:hypothetical protein